MPWLLKNLTKNTAGNLSIELILDENTKLTDVFISGGFINNEVFIKYLSLMQKNVRIKLSNIQNESAYGAALLMKDYL